MSSLRSCLITYIYLFIFPFLIWLVWRNCNFDNEIRMGKKNVRTLENGGWCYVWASLSFSWTKPSVWSNLWTSWPKWIPSLLMNTKVKVSHSKNYYCTVKYHKCDTLWAAEAIKLSSLLIYLLECVLLGWILSMKCKGVTSPITFP